jgi:NitT/TauT family transport system substrate-binding protein
MITRKQLLWPVFAVAMILAAGTVLYSCNKNSNDPLQTEHVRLRLQWFPQAQFAGYIVAKELGYYAANKLDVELLPAGPDLKPQVTVATGTDDIGIGVSNQVITARSNGVPLKIIAQIFQDSANRYVLKRENAIESLTDLRGKKVGLWLGGDEVEFIAMLKTLGMTLKDVQVIPQEFSVVPFLQGQYVLSEVTVYNELNEIRSKGYDGDKLQILSPKDYDAAIVSDMIFTTERYINQHPGTAQRFLEASLKGWKYCFENPDQAVDIVLKYNKELNKADQMQQLQAVLSLISTGASQINGIGFMDPNAYANADRILFDSGQIKKHVPPSEVYDDSMWTRIPKASILPTP